MRYRVYPVVIVLGFLGLVFISKGTIHKSAQTVHPERKGGGFAETAESPLSPPINGFIDYFDSELDSSETVGAAYTIVKDGRVLHTATHGYRRMGEPEMINEHTVFRLASVSKGFAGALACILEEEGVFSLDAPVGMLYPGLSLKDSSSAADMTLRHLLSHTTGLVPYAFDNLVEAGEDLESIIGRLDEVDISGPPGTLYGYQNVLFSMLDPIVRRSTGKSYEDLLSEEIFEPLGMEDASAGPMTALQRLNMAYPHEKGKDAYCARRPHEGYYNVMPAAGVNASIQDMSQWLLALLGYKPGLFSEAAITGISTPEIYTPLKARYTRNWQPFKGRYYSLGWRIYYYRGRKIIYHGGYIRGYRAEIGFCPEEGLGIAFLQNSPNGLASKCVPAFFDRCFDASDPGNSEEAKSTVSTSIPR